MNNSIITSPKTLVRGMRYRVKHFTSAEKMHGFLNAQFNNNWRETKESEPTKTGTYAYCGGQYCNVRDLD